MDTFHDPPSPPGSVPDLGNPSRPGTRSGPGAPSRRGPTPRRLLRWAPAIALVFPLLVVGIGYHILTTCPEDLRLGCLAIGLVGVAFFVTGAPLVPFVLHVHRLGVTPAVVLGVILSLLA